MFLLDLLLIPLRGWAICNDPFRLVFQLGAGNRLPPDLENLVTRGPSEDQ